MDVEAMLPICEPFDVVVKLNAIAILYHLDNAGHSVGVISEDANGLAG
tara:strand:- start:7224 stop:7367 length:144 start_codon:yes stop_codon:yes gene_type:complete